MNVLPHFKNIKLFVLDVDGVLTDGSLLLFDDGQMVRRMNIKDGFALQLAIKKNYRVLIISGGHSEAVRIRLHKLGINDIFLGCSNKKEILFNYAKEQNLTWSQILYMGDDLPDLIPMQMVGLACCPADAAPEIKGSSHYISALKGGNGCVRDVIEKVLKLNGDWNDDEGIVSQ